MTTGYGTHAPHTNQVGRGGGREGGRSKSKKKSRTRLLQPGGFSRRFEARTPQFAAAYPRAADVELLLCFALVCLLAAL